MEASLRNGPAGEERSAAKRGSRLAERQFGAVARRQLLAVGFSPGRLEHWLATGRLHLRYAGVYAWGRPDLGTKGELAAGLLLAGSGAALGGISALWWQKLLNRRPEQIHVDAPGRRASRGDVLIRHPVEVVRRAHRGLPVVSLPQALLASTETLTHDSLRLVLARAEFSHVLDLGEVAAGLGEGRHGSGALRAALDAHLPQLAHCESPLEVDFVLLCERFRIELPAPNVRIGRYRPDMLWREQRLIVELDGKDAHSTPAQIAADERRAAALRQMGFTIVRYTWAQVDFEAAMVAADLRRLLSAE